MGDEGKILRWHHRPIMDRTEFIRINREMFGSSSDVLVQRHLQEVLSGEYFENAGWHQTGVIDVQASGKPASFPQIYVSSPSLAFFGEKLYHRLLREVHQAGGEIFPGAKKNDLNHPFIYGYIWSEHLFTLRNKRGAVLRINGDLEERAQEVEFIEEGYEKQPRALLHSRTKIDLKEGVLSAEETRKYDTGLETKLCWSYSGGELDKRITLSLKEHLPVSSLPEEYLLVYVKEKKSGDYFPSRYPFPKPKKATLLAAVIRPDEPCLLYSIKYFRGDIPYLRMIPQRIDLAKMLKTISSLFLREGLAQFG